MFRLTGRTSYSIPLRTRGTIEVRRGETVGPRTFELVPEADRALFDELSAGFVATGEEQTPDGETIPAGTEVFAVDDVPAESEPEPLAEGEAAEDAAEEQHQLKRPRRWK